MGAVAAPPSSAAWRAPRQCRSASPCSVSCRVRLMRCSTSSWSHASVRERLPSSAESCSSRRCSSSRRPSASVRLPASSTSSETESREARWPASAAPAAAWAPCASSVAAAVAASAPFHALASASSCAALRQAAWSGSPSPAATSQLPWMCAMLLPICTCVPSSRASASSTCARRALERSTRGTSAPAAGQPPPRYAASNVRAAEPLTKGCAPGPIWYTRVSWKPGVSMMRAGLG
mmetsp:Transcript_9128/g.28479  ORF Transcript_9128/g.28479 Transcript_9128/m.28479 type:complete len:235 (+) Transcript_9128:522-1226(+)